jgi:hypothetical protein
MIPVSMFGTRWRGRRSLEPTRSPSGQRKHFAQEPRSATGEVSGAPFQRFECHSLRRVRHRMCAAQVLWSVMPGEVFDRLIDSAREVRGRSGLGQARKVGRKHAAPVDAKLPGAALVGEKDHVIVALVDMPKQPEKELERLAGDFVLSAVRGTDASRRRRLNSAMKASVPRECSVQFLEFTAKSSK